MPVPKFEGVNKDGLTYVEAIEKDVNDFINIFLFNIKNINNSDGDINFMNISNISNARFTLSVYYNKELEKNVPDDIAQKLKRKIAILIGPDQLLKNNN